MNREKVAKWKKVLHKVLFPKVWVILFLTVISTVSLICKRTGKRVVFPWLICYLFLYASDTMHLSGNGIA